MQKRQTFNLILLFIVVIAIVLLQLDDKDSQTQQKFSLSTLTGDLVKQIHVERRDYPDMIFLRENDDWMMTEPYHTRAAGNRIQGILDILTSRSKHQLPVKEIDLVQTGLIEPELRLILDNSWFEFGGVNPLDEHRYLLHNDTVHLIHDTLYPQLMTSPTFFIDNKLFANVSGIRSIQFRQGTIQQDISGNWQFSGESELNSEALKERILHWQTLQANSVQKAQGLSPLSSISIHFMNGEDVIVDVISEAPNLILQKPGSPVQYHISEITAQHLFPFMPMTDTTEVKR